MAKKLTYGATFTNGETVTRTTARKYTHAWRTFKTATGETIASGFSGTRDAAHNQCRLFKAREDLSAEVVISSIVPEGFEAQFKLKLPFRVLRFYQGEPDRAGIFETGRGRKHLRFATRAEAEAWIEKAGDKRVGVRWEVTDKEDPRGYRRKDK